ncbi:MAG TPA: hypothetical protein VGL51_08975 [Solirubrobacteraceae bacterium]
MAHEERKHTEPDSEVTPSGSGDKQETMGLRQRSAWHAPTITSLRLERTLFFPGSPMDGATRAGTTAG